jgi:hypothetical protein
LPRAYHALEAPEGLARSGQGLPRASIGVSQRAEHALNGLDGLLGTFIRTYFRTLLDEADVWVRSARFGYLEDYQHGQALLLIWDVESPDGDFDRPIIWSVGSKWTPDSQGRQIRHESGAERAIFRTSIYGRLIDRVINELKVDMTQYGSDKDARTWEGLGFHMRRETLTFPGAAERGFRGEVERLMPVAFLGKQDSGQGATPKTATTAAPQPTTPPAQAAALSNATGPEALVNRLKLLARKLDKAKFEQAALNIEEVIDHPDLLNQILDPSTYGFWEQARMNA